MSKLFIIAEIGINHNGDMQIAKRLINEAVDAGCDAVKFQKRNVDLVYSPEELAKERESPWGTTNGEQKRGLEFGADEYWEIDKHCKEQGIEWFASPWDLRSVEFLDQFNCKYAKVASPMLNVIPLVEAIAKQGRHTFVSTGMSTLDEIDVAVGLFKAYDCPFELMHCVSTYPMRNEDANLGMINTLKDLYPGIKVGYSGHERGVQISLAAVALGADSLERHITIDRSMYGSDQAASLGISGLKMLTRDARIIANARGDDVKQITADEQEIRNKLANPYWITQHNESGIHTS